ncbi:fatty-acid--CoA ligase [Mycolicibacterium litorale]|uniref:Fatty-acid--CoA ligase n=1 Tax=Mycolicibacterium litorale TaxID=758802 RepID=A0A6S6P380_9MYCO|nr:fatty-acid--CoA ligase [Mycolicibacterium litorale]BCI51110.1 fatty-acid--CoA ligase [Mycolicibacterium litorale]
MTGSGDSAATADVAGSLILTSDYRVPDPARVWPLLERRRTELAALGAHHVFVHTSVNEPDRVLVTMALHTAEPVTELLRSHVFLEWFDAVGVEDLPAVFAGELVERCHFDRWTAKAPAVVIAGVTVVQDLGILLDQVHRTHDLFRRNGIQNVWIFRALDDPNEVMFLQDVDDVASARRWLRRPETAAKWLTEAGVGPYPPVFVGTLRHVMRLDVVEPANGG